MMTNTVYVPRLLEQFAIDPSSFWDMERLLERYLSEKSVWLMQQFFTHVPLDEMDILDTCQV